MDSKELLQSITKTFYSDTTSNIAYMTLSEKLMDCYPELVSNEVIFIDLKSETTPLSPFLKICSGLDIPESYIKENCYTLQQKSFSSFLKTGIAEERYDPIIIEEIDYEKLRTKETILNFIQIYFNQKIIVLNAQNMGENAISILSSLNSEKINGKFIFCYNSMEMEGVSVEMRNFLQTVYNSSNYYSINTLEDISYSKKNSKKQPRINFKTLHSQLRTYRIFLDISKAYELTKKIESSNLLIDATQNESRLIYLEMGIVCFYYGDTDLATFFLSNIIDTQIEDTVENWAYYFMAYVSSRKNMTTLALRYISKAISKSKNAGDKKLYALSCMLDYIITEREESEYSTDKYFKVLELLDEENLINNKIYTSLNIPYGIMYNKELRHKMLSQVEKAMIDAQALKNKFGLSTDYHWMGIMMTHEGNKENALEWYNKSFALRKEIGDTSSIVKVSNGLAYEYLIDTKFKPSYELINNILHYLLESNDYAEIIITLFNFERSCFYSRNFKLTTQIINTILTIMSLFDISDLASNSFLPEYNDILIYKALLDYYSGEITRSKMNLHNVFNNGKPISQIESFLQDFLRAIFEIEDNNVDEALKIFNSCESNFIHVGISQEYRLVFMYYELACILDKKGFYTQAELYFKKGFLLAKQKNLVYYTKERETLTIKEYLDGQENFPELKIDFNQLLEKAEKEQLVNQLHKRLKDSQFLNKLTATHSNFMNDSRFISNIVQAVFDYCMAEAVFLAQKSDDGWEILGNVQREEIPQPQDKIWENIVIDSSVIQKNKFNGPDQDIICINLSKFEFTGAIIIYLQKRYRLSVEEMNILNIAATNIQALFVMLKQNEHLTKISATDQLSMLNNRRALQNHLAVESEMIRRYKKKKNVHLYDAISFIDLDNFKYYNDTFGHEAGDLLITCFAKLLKKIYRKVDFVARFGGDEFVVILPNTDCLEAKRAAERLQEGLENAEHFIPELKKLLNKELIIPQNRLLGFSMGISSNADLEDISNLETTMLNADKALYYSKQNKKGTVTIWNEIKDNFEESKTVNAE